LLLGLCLALGAKVASAEIWNDSEVFIERRFDQSGAVGAVPAGDGAFAFEAAARNNFTAQSQSLQLPAGSLRGTIGPSEFQLRGSHYVFEERFSNAGDIAARHVGGTYTWSISGGNSGGVVSPSLTVAQADPLDVTPQIVGGTWRNGRLLVEAANPRFSIAAWQSPPSNSQIEFGLYREGGAGGLATSPSAIQITWSAQPVGAVFQARLSYRTVLNETSVAVPSGGTLRSRYGRSATVRFQIEVVESLTPPVEIPGVQISNAVCVKWTGQTGKTYQVQRSTDLQTWTNFGASVAGTESVQTVFDELTGQRQFYRVVTSASPPASGLTILEALYGAGTTFSDVKSYVTAAISNGTVTMTVGNHTLGGDPAAGQVKSLFVRYQTSTGIYEITVSEMRTLQLPNPNATQVPQS
jgi:hypothetical protein